MGIGSRFSALLALAPILVACGGGGASWPAADDEAAIELRAPADGAILTHEDEVEIRWRAEIPADEAIVAETSTDGGEHWDEIGRALAGNRRLTWRPADPATDLRLRLRTPDGREVSRSRRIVVLAFPVEIVPGLDFMVARMSDDSNLFWGQYPYTFHREPVTIPAPFPELGGLRPAAAAHHVLALSVDGRVFLWGDHDGFRTLWPPMPQPEPVPLLGDIAAVYCEYDVSFAIGRDGRAWGWGLNARGSVGDGTFVDRFVPVRVPMIDGAVRVAVGRLHALALMPDGTLLAWGWNGAGQLGDGTHVDHPEPRPVPGIETAVDVAAGIHFSLALLADGTVLSWGGNSEGKLGDGSKQGRSLPGPVLDIDGVVEIHAGNATGYALDAEGRVWAWGRNSSGQFADGTFVSRSLPTRCQVPPVARLFVGSGTVHAFTRDDTWIAWGYGRSRTMGDGLLHDRAAPVSLQRW